MNNKNESRKFRKYIALNNDSNHWYWNNKNIPVLIVIFFSLFFVFSSIYFFKTLNISLSNSLIYASFFSLYSTLAFSLPSFYFYKKGLKKEDEYFKIAIKEKDYSVSVYLKYFSKKIDKKTLFSFIKEMILSKIRLLISKLIAINLESLTMLVQEKTHQISDLFEIKDRCISFISIFTLQKDKLIAINK